MAERAPDPALVDRVARTWARVLGVAEVDPDVNFFDLGGHSLLLVELADALRADLGWDIDLVWLMESPTVNSLTRQYASR